MTFLKKLGLAIAKGTALLAGIEPLLPFLFKPGTRAADVVTRISDTLSGVAALVVQVEAMSAAATAPIPGPERAKQIAPLVGQLILSCAAFQTADGKPRKVKNPALFADASQRLGGVVADFMNSFDDDGVE